MKKKLSLTKIIADVGRIEKKSYDSVKYSCIKKKEKDDRMKRKMNDARDLRPWIILNNCNT